LFLFQNKNPPKLKACCRPKPHRSSCGGAFLDPSGNIVLHPAADAGVFPDYPAPVVRNAGDDRELIMMRWGMPPPPKFGGQQHQTCKVRDGRRLLEHFSFGKK
jgi:putative SOS response-associated peptidase YedK